MSNRSGVFTVWLLLLAVAACASTFFAGRLLQAAYDQEEAVRLSSMISNLEKKTTQASYIHKDDLLFQYEQIEYASRLSNEIAECRADHDRYNDRYRPSLLEPYFRDGSIQIRREGGQAR